MTPSVPAALAELSRRGAAPLDPERPPANRPLRIAVIIPSFRVGSGGHATIVHLVRELRKLGHDASLWLEDFERRHLRDGAAVTAANFASFFSAGEIPFDADFDRWAGADVVVATCWQTVPRALLLSGARARAYLVQDHEPDFHGASAESLFAAETYRGGLHCIAASAWLAELLRARYGASATHFDLAVDHSVHHPADTPRRDDLVAFYARTATPRRAVPLGLLALEELARRRPGVQIALFGSDRPVNAPFRHLDLSVLAPAGLAALYREATVGMVFSLTNPSLTGLEMMACGLPCVELASEPMVASFGGNGPLVLAPPDPMAICTTMQSLLEDQSLRDRRARAGIAHMANRTWTSAAVQVEAGLRVAIERAR